MNNFQNPSGPRRREPCPFFLASPALFYRALSLCTRGRNSSAPLSTALPLSSSIFFLNFFFFRQRRVVRPIKSSIRRTNTHLRKWTLRATEIGTSDKYTYRKFRIFIVKNKIIRNNLTVNGSKYIYFQL